jgi:hypothetical protein
MDLSTALILCYVIQSMTTVSSILITKIPVKDIVTFYLDSLCSVQFSFDRGHCYFALPLHELASESCLVLVDLDVAAVDVAYLSFTCRLIFHGLSRMSPLRYTYSIKLFWPPSSLI